LTKIILRQKFKSWKNNIKFNNLIQTQISFYIKGYLGKKESLNLIKVKKDMNLHKESNIKFTLSKPNKISEKKIEQFYYELIAPKKIEEITQTINENEKSNVSSENSININDMIKPRNFSSKNVLDLISLKEGNDNKIHENQFYKNIFQSFCLTEEESKSKKVPKKVRFSPKYTPESRKKKFKSIKIRIFHFR
jgi:hypothetical protein